jgi:hypothetical protein
MPMKKKKKKKKKFHLWDHVTIQALFRWPVTEAAHV